MTTTDMTTTTSKMCNVIIKCEGIRTTGEYCNRETELSFHRTGQVGDGDKEGKRLTKPQRIAKARELAAKDGWISPKGFDACLRVHGFIPTVKPATTETA